MKTQEVPRSNPIGTLLLDAENLSPLLKSMSMSRVVRSTSSCQQQAENIVGSSQFQSTALAMAKLSSS